MRNKFLAGSALTAILVAGAPFVALAHDTNAQAKAGFNLGSVNLSSFVNAHFSGHDKDGKKDDNKVPKKAHVIATSTPFASIAAGKVTAINGSVLTIVGLFGHSTTTVVTDANTVFKAKGNATTSTAISVGGRVFVVGTTTATSTAGNTMSASIVEVIGKGLGHLRFWLWFKHH